MALTLADPAGFASTIAADWYSLSLCYNPIRCMLRAPSRRPARPIMAGRGSRTDASEPALVTTAFRKEDILRSFLASLVLLCLTTAFVSPATADPPDPHIPNMQANYCPGGQNGSYERSWCDGQLYPDDSYWRQELNVIFIPKFSLTCLLDPGSPFPRPAPPGACGGGA